MARTEQSCPYCENSVQSDMTINLVPEADITGSESFRWVKLPTIKGHLIIEINVWATNLSQN